MTPPRTRRYGPTTANFIRQALSGYPGGAAIASELIQNADDARASAIRFTFRPDVLEVWNDSVFREEDFEAIADIASGHKRADASTIGTWGTGFVSVYHLTDAPQLLSARRHVRFRPLESDTVEEDTEVDQETIFRLPWRIARSQLSEILETTDLWDKAATENLLNELAQRIYAFVLFLRHVRRIEVCVRESEESEMKLVAAVTKQYIESSQIGKVRRECWEVSYQQAGQRVIADKWLYYRSDVVDENAPIQVKTKDSAIALAFPVKGRPWLEKHLPGRLYNFLPTPIATGLDFQINGAYFPDNNRKAILIDDSAQHDKVRWNRSVLTAQAHLFVDILLDVREQVGEAERFYKLLPLDKEIPDLLHEFYTEFAAVAPEQPIIFNSLGQWVRPRDVLLSKPNSRLHLLAAPYLSVLPDGTAQSVRDYLAHAKLSTQITVQDVLKVLFPTLMPGKSLSGAHPMINDREKLTTLYAELAASIGSMTETDIKSLKPLALGLNDQNQLVPFTTLFRLESKQRSLFKTLEIRFVETKMLEAAPRLFEQVTPEFRGANLVAHLAELAWGIPPLQTIPAPLGGTQSTLEKLLNFIHADLANVDASKLATLPFVRSRQDHWYTARQQIYRHTNAKECDLLKRLALAFVHEEWVEVSLYRDLYACAGVAQLGASAVIDALERYLTARKDEEIPIATETLMGLFRYFQRQELTDGERERLRNLRLCRTQGERWVTAASNQAHLPTGRQLAPNIRRHLGKLDDNLIHDELLNDDSRHFLHRVLRVPLLDEAAIITDLVLPKYSLKRLDDEAKSTLLEYVLGTLPGLADEKQRVILATMAEMPILQAQNGGYYLPRQLYFPSEKLDTLFVAGYLAVHSNYGIPAALPGQTSTHQQHSWYPWLSRLGVAETARIGDVVEEIQRIVKAGSPTEALVNELRPLYIELNNNVGATYSAQDKALNSLRELAWLPAVNDSRRWHKPASLYSPRLTNHIGEQAPILRFGEPTTILRDLLSMAIDPPVEIVIQHLLASVAKQVEIRPDAVYDLLGRSATDAQIRNLKQQAVVWEPRQRRYWPAHHVFFTNQSHLFDKRRGYLERPSDNVLKFLQKLGVRDEPQLHDSLNLIQEIATNHQGNTLAPLELQLLNAQFAQLGRYLRNSEAEIAPVRLPDGLAFVPGSDGNLHLPTRIVQVDLPKALDHFDPATLPQLASDLGEDARYYLNRIGLQRLSHVMRRKIVEARNPSSAIQEQERLRQRANAFDRVAFKHLWHDLEAPPHDKRPSARLRNIQVKNCTRLEIQYYIDGLNGWHVAGEQRAVPVFYDDQYTEILYLTQGIRTGSELVALAMELDKVLFYDQAGCSIIEQLLTWQPAELDAQLDVRNFPSLPTDYISELILGASDEEIMGRYDETTPVVEEESHDIWSNLQGVQQDTFETGPLFNLPAFDMQKNGAHNGDQTANYTANPCDVDLASDGEDDSVDDGEEDWEDDRADNDKGTPIISPPMDDHYGAGNGTNGAPFGGSLRSPTPNATPHVTPSQHPVVNPTPATNGTGGDPIFTGQIRPHVPYRPNDYAALHERFGFPTVDDLQANDSDVHLQQVLLGSSTLSPVSDDDADDEFISDNSTPHTVRVLLSFQNRTEGFFTLNEPLQAMLDGAPARIICNTEFEDWAFPLYLDKIRGVLHNQESLPTFFDAHNIPAGGIVYLKRQTYDSVRLYWNQAKSQVESITCYELTEDGELEQFVIESAEYECEVSDAIVRAEKRLEDPAALFAQAQDKPGLFTVLCDILDGAKRALSYSEVARAVHATRPFSDYAIRFQLYTRPCFVQDADGCWRFEAERGYIPDQTRAPRRPAADVEKRQSRSTPTRRNGPSAASLAPSTVATLPSASLPYITQFQYVSDAVTGWHARLSAYYSLSALNQLEAFQQELHALYMRLKQDIAQLQAPSSLLDETLVTLWKEIQGSPATHAQTERVVEYLATSDARQEDLILATVDHCLVQTAPEIRASLFLPALAQTATRARSAERTTFARALYLKLQQQGGGNFSAQLDELDRLDNLDNYLAELAEAKNRTEKWQWAEIAWQEYPHNPRLRQTLLLQMKNDLAKLPSIITAQKDAASGAEALIIWLQQVRAFMEMITVEDELSGTLLAQAKTLWLKLVALWQATPQERVYPQQMLRMSAAVAGATNTIYRVLPADQLLTVLYAFAASARKKDNPIAATALAEYARSLIEPKSRELKNQATYKELFIMLTDLHENQGLFHLAYSRLSVARRLTLKMDEKLRLNARHEELRKRRDEVSTEAHEVFMRQLEAQLDDRNFAQLVETDNFRKMVAGLEAPPRHV